MEVGDFHFRLLIFFGLVPSSEIAKGFIFEEGLEFVTEAERSREDVIMYVQDKSDQIKID